MSSDPRSREDLCAISVLADTSSMWGRCILVWLTVGVASVAMSGCGSTHVRSSNVQLPVDARILVPWTRIGDIALGDPRARVEQEHGSAGHGYHVLQRTGTTPS